MSWLVIKKYFTKTLLWLKHHWYIPLSGLAILVSYVLFKEKAESLMKALMDNREGYKEQARKVDEIHEKQINERNRHLSETNKKLKEIDEKHEDKLKEIEDKKEDLVEDLKAKDDLAAELDKEFNL